MRKKRIPLILIAVAVMCLAATSVFAYNETWSGWWVTGTITYNSNTYTLDYAAGGGTGYSNSTGGARDTFPVNTSTFHGQFVCTQGCLSADTIKLIDSTYSTHYNLTGGKETGQTGQKEGNGTWCAFAYTTADNDTFFVWGTWDAYTADNNGFDYTQTPPRVDGDWEITGDNSQYSVSGSGTIAAIKTN